MAIRTKEEIIASIKNKFGDDTSDETIALLEDISDTLDTTKDGIEWKQKYEENDRQWREKYTSRFYDTGADDKKDKPEDKPDDKDEEAKASTVTFNDLFTEKEK